MEPLQTDEDRMNKITTRDHTATIIARIQREPKFARALYAEAINALLEGETNVGLSILRDLVNAEISFKELARQTGLGEKSLHRMLNRNGNPTARNLSVIIKSIAEDTGRQTAHRVRLENRSGPPTSVYFPVFFVRSGGRLHITLVKLDEDG